MTKKIDTNLTAIATIEFVNVEKNAKAAALRAMLSALVALATSDDSTKTYKTLYNELAKTYEPNAWEVARSAATRNLRAAYSIFNARAITMQAAVKKADSLDAAIDSIKACLPKEASNPSKILATYTTAGKLKNKTTKNETTKNKATNDSATVGLKSEDFDYDTAITALNELVKKASAQPFAKFFFTKMAELAKNGAKASLEKAA